MSSDQINYIIDVFCVCCFILYVVAPYLVQCAVSVIRVVKIDVDLCFLVGLVITGYNVDSFPFI